MTDSSIGSPVAPIADGHGWFPVTDAGTVGLVRRAATALGQQISLAEERLAELAIVSTELAGNLYKYATDGLIHLRTLRYGQARGVQLLAIDSGPGMPDLALSTVDGHSTSGTLGLGLGSIRRQASDVDGYSRIGRGTVLSAAVWSDPPPRSWADGVSRPISGESVSGDGYAVRGISGRLQAMLCDGLGHGRLAGAAAQQAGSAFRTAPAGGPKAVVQHLHRALSHTRGVVAAVIELARPGTPGAGVARFAGLGNISAWVIDSNGRRGLTSLPGIVGHQAREVREFEYPVARDATVVMHTDGLTDRWDLAGYPGLLTHQPLVVAATLLRDAGTRSDDAGVLVARLPA
jgi:anti-sigma regulatory factor (Ser/Thr protein kinase)